MTIVTYLSYFLSFLYLCIAIYGLYTLKKTQEILPSYNMLMKFKVFLLSPYSVFLRPQILNEVGPLKKRFFIIHIALYLSILVGLYIDYKMSTLIAQSQEQYIQNLQKNR